MDIARPWYFLAAWGFSLAAFSSWSTWGVTSEGTVGLGLTAMALWVVWLLHE